MQEFNIELKCTAYFDKEAILVEEFVKGMDAFQGSGEKTNANVYIHFLDGQEHLADEIKVDITMPDIGYNEALDRVFDWNAHLETSQICRVAYLSEIHLSIE